jgi:hypothetical protein
LCPIWTRIADRSTPAGISALRVYSVSVSQSVMTDAGTPIIEFAIALPSVNLLLVLPPTDSRRKKYIECLKENQE